jgi:para-nitrobenzyl esterase
VWLYRFDHATPMLRLIGLGAAHASEVPYVWRRLDDPSMELSLRLGGRRQAAAISERMSGRWLAFARGGDPDPEEAADAGAAARSTATATVAGAAEGSAEGAATAAGRAAPAWPRYDVEERLTLLIDLQDRVVTDPDADLRRGWGDELLAFP